MRCAERRLRLGLTLYEMLALRPAFDGSARERLIEQVGTPSRRAAQGQPEVPRDLETIVLKAIERDPAERYQTAGELAEDLRRFLEDRPIQARRSARRSRPGDARRNPAIACTRHVAGLLLAALAVGSTVAAVWLNAERKRALDHLWAPIWPKPTPAAPAVRPGSGSLALTS